MKLFYRDILGVVGLYSVAMHLFSGSEMLLSVDRCMTRRSAEIQAGE